MRPGVNVTTSTVTPVRGFPSNTGAGFVAGLAERGPTEATQVRNLREFRQLYGERVSYGYLYDAADVFFRLGGTELYVVRVVGPAATKDAVTFTDGATTPANTIRVESIGPGATDFSAAIQAGETAGTYRIQISDTNGVLETSPDLVDNDAAVGWAENSPYIRVVKLGATDPAVAAATALTGGNDDQAAITDTQRIDAIARFSVGLGPGQVYYPGATTTAVHSALLEHASERNRFALLDAPNTATVATLISTADALGSGPEVSYGMLLAPWATIPGVVRNITRTVPYSVVQAGLIAGTDGRTGNPNIPAAGTEGQANYALDVTQAYTDADRERLNTAGVNIARLVYGSVRTYGYRTLADENNANYDGFVEASAARTRMAIVNEALAAGEDFAFDQISPSKVAEWDAHLRGVLDRYWRLGALFGDTAEEAYAVDTGPAVNTPTTLADRQLNAALGVRISPFAEQVNIEISRVPVSATL